MLTTLVTSLRAVADCVILPRAGEPSRFEITIRTDGKDDRVNESIEAIERMLKSKRRKFQWLLGRYDRREFRRYQIRAIQMPNDDCTVRLVRNAEFVVCVEKKTA